MKKSERERLENQQRITRVALADANRSKMFAALVCNMAAAAEQALEARLPVAARMALSAIQNAEVEFHNTQVSVLARTAEGEKSNG